MEKIKCVLKRHGEPAKEICVENTLSALQELVGGNIETVTFAEDCCLICDEEGRLKGLPYNFTLLGIDFVGSVLAVGTLEDEFCSLGENAIQHLERWME